MERHGGVIMLATVLALGAATSARATHPEVECGHFTLTEPLVLPRQALVVSTLAVRADAVALNGECVSQRARVRRRPGAGVRFIAIFRDCGRVARIKVRGHTDPECTGLRGRLISRRPAFRSNFTALPTSEHDCRFGHTCERRCGTIAGLPCPDGSVCDLEAGMCGVVDLGGECVPEPEACPEIYAPVCGCDGITYGNDCERLAAGAQKDRDGPCKCAEILCPPDTVPVDRTGDGCPDECLSARCETSADCPDDRWCAPMGGFDCAAPGFCLERPTACPDVWLPVCGCDGITYSNDCDAAAAGARIAHGGTCANERTCGTIVGIPCPDGMFCDFPPGSCLVADEAGTCVPRGGSCIALYDPVCGCNGVTYANDCHRIVAGVSKAHHGVCT